jgi:hypothetical protein
MIYKRMICPTCGRTISGNDRASDLTVNTVPNPEYHGYFGKAERLLARWPGWGTAQGEPIPLDGEWAKVGLEKNTGAKMLIWMCNQRMIERRHSILGGNVASWKNDWYRRLP